MTEMTSSTMVIALVIFAGAIIAAMSFGIMDMLQGDTNTHAQIDSKEEMMKLILYDAMIAYNCDKGGNVDDPRGAGGKTHWGSWDDMRQLWKSPSHGQISFDELNKSMPTNFKGLPCYSTDSTLPLSGGPVQEAGVAGEEWKDDQHGKYSRIKFEVDDEFKLPHCFTHYTENDFSFSEDMYEGMAGDEVTNSWFLVVSEQEKGAWHAGGAGIGSGEIDIHYECQKIARSGTVDDGYGPIMTVNVIDTAPSTSLTAVSTVSPDKEGGHGISDPQGKDKDIAQFIGGNDFFEPYSSSPDDPRPLKEYRFPEGTKGYVQTNIGCNPGSPPYTSSNTPGQSTGEITGNGDCANALKPFIMITKVGQ